VGVDFMSQPLFVTYWYALYIATFLLVVTFRFARPLYLSLRHSLVVDRVEVEARGIYSIYLKGRDLDKLKYQGGQYAIWYFLAPQLWWQGHPFSFSSHPSTGQPRITVKNSGDYTAILDKVAPGTPIIMDGAYGIFTAEQSKADKILLVAGGIGMTPLLSMLPDLLERTKDITFLYAVRSEADIAHRDELETMGIRLIIVASDDPNFSGERGVVDAPRLNALVPDAAEREAYLCGPPAMMMAVENALIAVDVHPHYIHTEEFSF
jgi:ferredoxin-NADP reductase